MKAIMILILTFLLCGCGKQETFETVSDELLQPAMASPREFTVRLPDNAVAPVMENETEQVYMSEDYEIVIETLASGDLDATIRTLSGYGREKLTIMETQWDDVTRYEFVWVSTGEQGQRLGRGVVLDDGNYHYCLSVLRDAEERKMSQIVWSDVFGSFQLV